MRATKLLLFLFACSLISGSALAQDTTSTSGLPTPRDPEEPIVTDTTKKS
jgi:hypothetical protein